MSLADDEEKVRQAHSRYFEALGSGSMDTLAENFTFPAAFKGFLDDVVIATDEESLLATYQRLIAAAPKATRTELDATEVSSLRPNVYMLTMSYRQFGADDELIHEGQAVYFMKIVNGECKLFAVF
jgi:hypothetical protein